MAKEDADLLPNDGQAYSSDPKVETQAEVTDKSQVLEAAQHLDSIIEWFDQQIANADSLQNIETTKTTFNGVVYERKVSVEAQVLAAQIIGGEMATKRQEYIDFRNKLG